MSGTGTSSSSPVSLSPAGRAPPPSGPHSLCQEAAEGLQMEDGCGGWVGTAGLLSRPETPPQGTHIVFADHVASGSGVTALQG